MPKKPEDDTADLPGSYGLTLDETVFVGGLALGYDPDTAAGAAGLGSKTSGAKLLKRKRIHRCVKDMHAALGRALEA